MTPRKFEEAQSLHRCCLALACVLLLWPAALPAQPAAQRVDDGRFRATYLHQYKALEGVAPDMVVMELRDRVELVASRGSYVGAPNDDRRVRGFESALLLGLQAAVCQGTSMNPERPLPIVVEKIDAAASAQRLRPQADDVAMLSALAQRLLDNQPRERWCSLKSLDEIR